MQGLKAASDDLRMAKDGGSASQQPSYAFKLHVLSLCATNVSPSTGITLCVSWGSCLANSDPELNGSSLGMRGAWEAGHGKT